MRLFVVWVIACILHAIDSRDVFMSPNIFRHCALSKMSQEIALEPGGRELFAPVLKFYPRGNFFPFQFGLSMGSSAQHGGLIRSKTEGQFPVVCICILYFVFCICFWIWI